MSDLSTYDSLLAEVIKAPRLSGSKVKTLTELALSLVQHDTHLVTAIYKQFKARPSKSTQRISALYVFDAIARAARSAVKAAKSRAKEPGTPASLLAKMEGIVDGIVDGMIEDGWKEGRDKLRKVSDIWQKANTFPPAAMERIQSKLTATPPAPVPDLETEGDDLDDGPSYASVPAAPAPLTQDDSKVTTPSTTPPPAGALPASIMALLGKQAQAQATASGLSTNSTPPPPVDIAALLANVNKVVQQPSQTSTPPVTTPALNQAQLSMLASYSQAPPFQYQQPQAGPSRSRSPPVPPRARDPRERSRSPQRRDPRSPPQRDPRIPQAATRAVDPRDPRSRVARPESEQTLPSEATFNHDANRQSHHQPLPVAAHPTPSPHPAPAPIPVATPQSGPVTLQTFDFTTFDGTKPDSWVALAQAWTNTTGAEPNQMQLMMFISTGQIMTNNGPAGRGMGVGRF